MKLSEFYNLGSWLGKKMEYHKVSSDGRVKRKQVNMGEIRDCDFGYNIGEEKNKKRPVIVISSNKLYRMGKVVVAPITDAKDKINSAGLPCKNTDYLPFSETTDSKNWYKPTRTVPKSGNLYSCLRKDSVMTQDKKQHPEGCCLYIIETLFWLLQGTE